MRDGDAPEILLNEEENNEATHTFVANKRTAFTRELEIKGVRRPNHAAMNSRA